MKTAITNRSTLKNIPLLMALCVLSLASVVQFSFAQTGYAVGKMGTIVTTTNGTKWTYLNNPSGSPRDITSVSFIAPNNLWVVAAYPGSDFNSFIYRGQVDPKGTKVTWTKQAESDTGPPPLRDTFRAISFKSATDGIAVGDSGRILWTNNGGAKWNESTNKAGGRWTTVDLKDVFFLPGTKQAWAVGDSETILNTTDGGMTWKPVVLPNDSDINFRSVWIADANNWWFAGSTGIVWTTNAAKNWHAYDYISGFEGIQALKDKKNVWAAGARIFNNPNWGKKKSEWMDKTVGATPPFHGLSFIDNNPGNGWVVGDNGIFRNSGAQGGWSKVYSADPRFGLLKIVMFPNKKPGVKLNQSATPGTGTSGVDYLSLTASGFPEGNINPANVVVELATECHEAASATTSAVSIVSGSGDSQLLSFLLPSGLAPGQYFVSISDSAESDANFESSNCSAVSVAE